MSVLIMSGLDPSGYAGFLRDVAALSFLKIKPQGVITALTSQTKTSFGVVFPLRPEVLRSQFRSVAPFVRSIKVGMLANATTVKEVARFFKTLRPRPFIVVDPVCTSTTGGVLLTPSGQRALLSQLLPLVNLWTPNLDEARLLLKLPLQSKGELEEAARRVCKKYGNGILIKGFKKGGRVWDLLGTPEGLKWFSSWEIKGRFFRGSGCALSSLIAGGYSQGKNVEEAVAWARRNFRKVHSP